MDIHRIKKYADSVYDSYKITKTVTEVENEMKSQQGGRDIVMSDYFKTLNQPLIEQQKKTDEKQDKLIEQLQKNQKAFTSGFEDLVLFNQLPEKGDQKTTLPPDYKPALM